MKNMELNKLMNNADDVLLLNFLVLDNKELDLVLMALSKLDVTKEKEEAKELMNKILHQVK